MWIRVSSAFSQGDLQLLPGINHMASSLISHYFMKAFANSQDIIFLLIAMHWTFSSPRRHRSTGLTLIWHCNDEELKCYLMLNIPSFFPLWNLYHLLLSSLFDEMR